MSRIKMLHDHEDGGKISRKRGQYLAQRPQTACGCGKRDDVKGAAESSCLPRITLYRNTFFLFANKAANKQIPSIREDREMAPAREIRCQASGSNEATGIEAANLGDATSAVCL